MLNLVDFRLCILTRNREAGTGFCDRRHVKRKKERFGWTPRARNPSGGSASDDAANCLFYRSQACTRFSNSEAPRARCRQKNLSAYQLPTISRFYTL
jgi:hypothetical protein